MLLGQTCIGLLKIVLGLGYQLGRSFTSHTETTGTITDDRSIGSTLSFDELHLASSRIIGYHLV